MRRLLLVVVAAVLCMITFASLQAAIIEVDCKGPGLRTIQEGVDAAAEGDTILIAPCVYEEQVTLPGKAVILQGSGAGVTELLWEGSGAAMSISMTGDGIVAILDLRITRVPDSDWAVTWDEHTMVFENCRITGGCGGGYWYGGAILDNSTMTGLSVTGGLRSVDATNSRIGRLAMSSPPYGPGLSLRSSGSRYGEILLGCQHAYCSGDSIGKISVSGGLDCGGGLEAEDSTVDLVEGSLSPEIVMERCAIGELVTRWDDETSDYPPLFLRSCLVTGSVLAEYGWSSGSSESGGAGDSREYYGGVLLEHNTILGDLAYPFDVTWWGDPYTERRIRSNIVSGQTELFGGEHMVISHNDFVGGLVVTDPGDSVYANIAEPPLFCYPAGGDYTLQDCSPCVGAAHDGGDIGAFGVGCACVVPVEQRSWGAIKAMFK